MIRGHQSDLKLSEQLRFNMYRMFHNKQDWVRKEIIWRMIVYNKEQMDKFIIFMDKERHFCAIMSFQFTEFPFQSELFSSAEQWPKAYNQR